jgi:A/G-specific adenine glycosylase
MQSFSKDLITWFEKSKRVLPWRVDPSLYKTVVSEFMLQQTQVITVIGYFNRWMILFPSFSALAQAPQEVVLKAWEGLGYYARARNLHILAKQIVQLESIPQDHESWQKFKGIGPYTAAAITSLAFRYPAAVVDGNVVRILSRITADETLYSAGSVAMEVFRPLARTLLDTNRPGEHNEAMMELGATICTKHNPLCTVCPIFGHCKAGPSGQANLFPKIKPKEIINREITRVWIADSHRVLFSRAHTKARRLADLYELPDLSELGLVELPEGSELLLKKSRGIANERITEHIYHVQNFRLPDPLPDHFHWIDQNRVSEVTLSGPHRRWVNEIQARPPYKP